MAEKIPSRQELAREDTWAIEDLYETDEAWLSDLEKLKALGARLPGYAGKISADAKTLLEYQRLGEEISLLLDSLANYAQRKSDEDTRNPVYQDLTGKLTKVWVQLGADTAFEVPELLSISDERMEEFYREEPELQLYRRHFDVIRRKKEHILSESEEKLLAMAGEMAGTPEEIYSLLQTPICPSARRSTGTETNTPSRRAAILPRWNHPTGRCGKMPLRACMRASARIKTRLPRCSAGRSSSWNFSRRRAGMPRLWKRLWMQRRFPWACIMH